VGVSAWAVSNAAELMLGQTFWTSIARRRMNDQVATRRDHYIVCGYGRLGQQIVQDLRARGETFVVIDFDDALEDEMLEGRIPHLLADATTDAALSEARIGFARGLVAALDTDANNVLTVLTARGLNPDVLIVARANNDLSEPKLRRAGADRVIAPSSIGGHRLALALLRPAVDDFFTRVFNFEVDQDIDVGQVTIPKSSPFHGKSIAQSGLRRVRNLTILAVRKEDGGFDLTPGPDRVILAGETLIIIGPSHDVYDLEATYGSESG
jgi:voltage-gated potassium channel